MPLQENMQPQSCVKATSLGSMSTFCENWWFSYSFCWKAVNLFVLKHVLKVFKYNSHHTNLFLFQMFHGKFLITWAALQQEAVLRQRLIRDGRGRGGGRRGWAGMDRKCASSTNYKHDPSGHLRVIVYVHHCLPLVPVCFFTSAVLQSCKRRAEDWETITSPHARLLPSSRGEYLRIFFMDR